MKSEAQRFRVMLSCPDRRGIIAEVSAQLSSLGMTVIGAAQFTDPASSHFFMRYEVKADGVERDVVALESGLREGLGALVSSPGARLVVREEGHRPRVALLASKTSHCVVDVLQRWRTGELACDIVCVIANHAHIAENAGWFKVPFHHVDFTQGDKAASFDAIDRLLNEYAVDLTVLARFMQVFPDHLAKARFGRMINIHHSFLPSFAGARPYDQAHARGVKLVGATCHYVTSDLDEGPIIDQEVVRISHRDTPLDLRRKGRLCEREALARGLRLHIEDRVFVQGHRTVVFD